jgi:hypothetical protein
MRNHLRRRLATVTVAAAAVALLSANVAGARTGPDACPRLHGTSRIITPTSCGPPPPPAPPPLNCDLTVNPPVLDGFYVKVKARVDCNRVAGSIAMTVSLYRGATRVGPPQSYDNTGRSSLDNYNQPLSRFCDASGRFTGKASATIVRPYGEPGQPITLNASSAPRDITCPGIS